MVCRTMFLKITNFDKSLKDISLNNRAERVLQVCQRSMLHID